MKKYQIFFSEHFQFLDVTFSIYLNRRALVMDHVWYFFYCIYSLLCLLNSAIVASRRIVLATPEAHDIPDHTF